MRAIRFISAWASSVVFAAFCSQYQTVALQPVGFGFGDVSDSKFDGTQVSYTELVVIERSGIPEPIKPREWVMLHKTERTLEPNDRVDISISDRGHDYQHSYRLDFVGRQRSPVLHFNQPHKTYERYAPSACVLSPTTGLKHQTDAYRAFPVVHARPKDAWTSCKLDIITNEEASYQDTIWLFISLNNVKSETGASIVPETKSENQPPEPTAAEESVEQTQSAADVCIPGAMCVKADGLGTPVAFPRSPPCWKRLSDGVYQCFEYDNGKCPTNAMVDCGQQKAKHVEKPKDLQPFPASQQCPTLEHDVSYGVDHQIATSSIFTATPAGCCSQCTVTLTCVAFTWYQSNKTSDGTDTSSAGNCALYSGVARWRKHSYTGAISGIVADQHRPPTRCPPEPSSGKCLAEVPGHIPHRPQPEWRNISFDYPCLQKDPLGFYRCAPYVHQGTSCPNTRRYTDCGEALKSFRDPESEPQKSKTSSASSDQTATIAPDSHSHDHKGSFLSSDMSRPMGILILVGAALAIVAVVSLISVFLNNLLGPPPQDDESPDPEQGPRSTRATPSSREGKEEEETKVESTTSPSSARSKAAPVTPSAAASTAPKEDLTTAPTPSTGSSTPTKGSPKAIGTPTVSKKGSSPRATTHEV